MTPDSLDFITRGTDDQQAEYAAAHKTTVPAAEGEANAGAVKSSASPSLPRKGGADTNSSEQWVTVPAIVNTPAPRWSAVDDNTSDLLSILAIDGVVPVDEWPFFLKVLKESAASNGGVIDQNHTRPRLHGQVRPARIGAYFRRACREGLIRPAGYTVTDNSESGNVGRPAKSYAWLGT